MKTKLIISFFAILLFCSCEEQKQVNDQEITVSNDSNFKQFSLDTLKGIYTGEFNKHSISIVLNHVSNNHIVGYNVYKGKKRNLFGTYSRSNDTVRVILNEPGDLNTDGKFIIEFYLFDLNAEGKWESFKGNLVRNFKLEKSLQLKDYDYKNINEHNIATIFSITSDSLGTFEIMEDGSCNYSYYTIEDEKNRVEHLKVINGNWTYKNRVMKIDWEKEEKFPGFFEELELVYKEDYPIFVSSERNFYPFF